MALQANGQRKETNMSKMVHVLLDDETERRLGIIAKALDRKESELIDSAVSEAVNDYWRNFKCGRAVTAPEDRDAAAMAILRQRFPYRTDLDAWVSKFKADDLRVLSQRRAVVDAYTDADAVLTAQRRTLQT